MININEQELEQKLLDAYNNLYGNNIDNYLVIETISFQLDDYDETIEKINYNYFLTIRCGNKEKCIHTLLLLNTEWSYDFIQGYFTRILEEKEEED
jgi:hypothetical protein